MRRTLEKIRSGISRRVHDQRIQRRLQIGSSLALGIGLLVSASLFLNLFGLPESRLADFVYQPRAPSGQVIIVSIDDPSLQRIGAWPWPRATLAELVRDLSQAQPRVLALDLVLPDPTRDDAALAQALASAPRVVQPIIGVEATRFESSQDSFPRFAAGLKPAPLLQTDNTLLGHTMLTPDADGVLRRVALTIDASDRRYPAFGLAALQVYQGDSLAQSIENGRITFGALNLPVDAQGRMRLNFVSWNTENVISAGDVLSNRVNLGLLRGKIVLIGMMNSASQESFQTPLSLGGRPDYAVEIQADLIETLLGNYLLREQDRLTQILLIFLVALLAGATLPHVRFVSAIGLTLLYFVMYLSYAFGKFDEGIVVQPVYPILGLLLTAGGTIVFRYFSEERPRAFLGRLFRRYVSPDALDQVLRNFADGALPMEGSRRMVTILYVDLRDFGPLTDSLAPSAAIKMLNQYMTLIVGTVFRHGGSLSKHTGDTVIAVWNLPLDQVDHAHRAVRAAVEIRRDLRAITAAQPKDTAIQVGIAIATGNVIAGHIGASPREEYTILGEVVGLAERMAMKSDRGRFIDLATREQVGDEYETQEVNPVRLRRRTDPVLVWQIIEPMELEEKPVAEKKTETDPN